jgi:hypothetical protein
MVVDHPQVELSPITEVGEISNFGKNWRVEGKG